nr:choline/ethanolamine kinase family protein [Nocardioides cynanchi]
MNDSDLDRLAVLAGRSRQVTELPGGLTNLNLRVTLDDREVVVRIVRSDAGLLAIDQEAEHANTLIAAQAGVGAGVLEHRPELGTTVLEFLPGRTLVESDFAEPAVLDRAADAVRRLHAAPRFVNDFDMFARQERYRQVVAEHGFPLPASYDDHAPAWADVRRVMTATAGATVPCNNDLLAGNFIDDGARVWLIDYDYSGNNDPCFELGNTATECEFDADLTRAWTAAYAGRDDPRLLARVRLQALCSEYGWSLWGFIQAGSSALDFDFHGWGMHRFEKAARTFTSPELPRLLEQVSAGG